MRLTGLGRAELNGRVGTVVSLEHASARYGVSLGGKPFSVRPSNVVYLVLSEEEPRELQAAVAAERSAGGRCTQAFTDPLVRTPLIDAAGRGRTADVAALLAGGADVKADETPCSGCGPSAPRTSTPGLLWGRR